jgi:cell division cycle 2-like protein
MTKEIMTLWYRAPEVLLDNLLYTKEIDLWSAGTIIYEMLTGTQMFRANSELDMIIQILNLKGTPIPWQQKS